MPGLTLDRLIRYGSTRFSRSTVTTVRQDTLVRHTFAELADRADRLALALAAGGVGPGDVVATACRNHHEHLEVMFASHLLGASFAPLNSRVDDASLTGMVETIHPAALVADPDAAARFIDPATAGVRRISVGAGVGWEAYEDVLASRAEGDAVVPVDDENTEGALLFTGGTTGTPKAAAYTHRQIYLHAMAVSHKSGMPTTGADTALGLVPICHGLGWQIPYQAWLTGANLAFIDGPLPGEAVIAAIEATGATASAAVPTVWHDVVRAVHSSGRTSLAPLTTVMLGGAMIPPTLPERLAELGVTVHNGWGMTETLASTISVIASPDPDVAVAGDVRISRPIPGMEVRAIDEAGTPVEGPGQLEVRAPWISGRYLGRPEPTGDWFATGDIGEVSPGGDFTIIGRAKEVIKSGGEQIWPSLIEDALLRHPDVSAVTVVEIPHERWGGQPLACVVLHGPAKAAELRAFLLQSLPKWQVPTVWAVLDELPRTAIGKVDRRELARRYEAGLLACATT
jgi:fatty-acyl-CoA synthase